MLCLWFARQSKKLSTSLEQWILVLQVSIPDPYISGAELLE